VTGVRWSISGRGSAPPTILEHPTSLVVVREEPATLRCEAAGDPEPEIIWMRTISAGGEHLSGDGSLAAGATGVMEEVVATAPAQPDSHRVLLPAGSLFFLRYRFGRPPSLSPLLLGATKLTWNRTFSLVH
jgi:hypothetical protein